MPTPMQKAIRTSTKSIVFLYLNKYANSLSNVFVLLTVRKDSSSLYELNDIIFHLLPFAEVLQMLRTVLDMFYSTVLSF